MLTACVLAGSLSVVVGAAVAADGREPTIDGERAVGVVATGVTPNGGEYAISLVDPSDETSMPGPLDVPGNVPSEAVCLDVLTDEARGGGCLIPPEAGRVTRGAVMSLGEAMFVLAVTDTEVRRLSARRADGLGQAMSTPAHELGSVNLLHAVLDAPASTFERASDGRLEKPAMELTAFDEAGSEIATETVAAPASAEQ